MALTARSAQDIRHYLGAKLADCGFDEVKLGFARSKILDDPIKRTTHLLWTWVYRNPKKPTETIWKGQVEIETGPMDDINGPEAVRLALSELLDDIAPHALQLPHFQDEDSLTLADHLMTVAGTTAGCVAMNLLADCDASIPVALEYVHDASDVKLGEAVKRGLEVTLGWKSWSQPLLIVWNELLQRRHMITYTELMKQLASASSAADVIDSINAGLLSVFPLDPFAERIYVGGARRETGDID